MKIARIALCALIATSASAVTAAAHPGALKEDISFTYQLDIARMNDAEGAQAVYADLVNKARRACNISGQRSRLVVDTDCAAELVTKVVDASRSAMLRAEHDGAYRAVQADDVARDQLASVR